jgi:hypothetical protein
MDEWMAKEQKRGWIKPRPTWWQRITRLLCFWK